MARPVPSASARPCRSCQDITSLLNLPANITIQAQSDVEIPEPASLALLGIGLAGLGAMRRRRQA